MMSKNNTHNETAGHFDIPVVNGVPEDILTLPASQRFIGDMITNKASAHRDDNHHILQIQNNAFSRMGIHSGDFVIASNREIARGGDLIVAALDNENFPAVFYPAGKKIRLERDQDGKNILVLDPALPGFQLKGKIIQIIRPLNNL